MPCSRGSATRPSSPQSYLSEVPLVSASLGRRAAAMAIDVAIPVVHRSYSPTLIVTSGQVSRDTMLVALGIAVTAGFITYVLVGETRLGQTLGKHWLNLLVVRESGARISVGQAIVRLLPSLLHVWWVDVIFALFTDKASARLRSAVEDAGRNHRPRAWNRVMGG
jgi:uncharacterized RDD family membrane protein YckC